MSLDDKEMQDKLLKDPQVQEAMKRAGEKALEDPAVQAKIVEVAKEKFPEYAGKAKDAAVAWARDPEVQAKACYYAGVAGKYMANAGNYGVGLVEQGPTGVRILAFAAGCLSTVCAGLFVISIGNIISNIAAYMVSCYQIVFSLTTMVFESPPEVIAKVPGITGYQDLLLNHAAFIGEVLGRGLFYIFQGSLWLAFAGSPIKILNLLAGLALLAVGALHVVMHFGKLQTLATKMRSGYEAVATGAQ